MAKKRITRADFIGLRMIRPETGMNGQPMQRSARNFTEEEYYYYYNKEDYYTYLYYLYMNPYYYGDDWHNNPDDPYWWGEGNPYGSLYYIIHYGGERGEILEENWACMFNCMTLINPSLSAREYYEKYMSTGPALDPARVGGLDISVHIQALQVCGFRVTEIYNFMEITDGITIVVYNMPSSGLTHAAIGVNFVKDTMDNLGNEADMVIVHDPSLTSEKKEYRVNKLYVRAMYKIW